MKKLCDWNVEIIAGVGAVATGKSRAFTFRLQDPLLLVVIFKLFITVLTHQLSMVFRKLSATLWAEKQPVIIMA